MSRSKRGGKAPGTEYWSKRPFNHGGQPTGPASKKRTHKAERREGRTIGSVDAIDADGNLLSFKTHKPARHRISQADLYASMMELEDES